MRYEMVLKDAYASEIEFLIYQYITQRCILFHLSS